MTQAANYSLQALNDAVFSRLSGAISVNVYDEVPAETGFNCVTIGAPVSVKFEARSVVGETVRYTLSAWMKDVGGKRDVYGVIDEIVAKLTESKLTITGWKEVHKYFGTAIVERLKDGISYEGRITMDITVVRAS